MAIQVNELRLLVKVSAKIRDFPQQLVAPPFSQGPPNLQTNVMDALQ